MPKSMSYKIEAHVPKGIPLDHLEYLLGSVVFGDGKYEIEFQARPSKIRVGGWNIHIAGHIREDFSGEIERAVKAAVKKSG